MTVVLEYINLLWSGVPRVPDHFSFIQPGEGFRRPQRWSGSAILDQEISPHTRISLERVGVRRTSYYS